MMGRGGSAASAAMRNPGRFSRYLKTAGRFTGPLFGAWMAYDIFNDINKLRSPGLLDENGKRKSALATAIRTAGLASMFIPGVGWVAGLGLNLAADGIAGLIQNRATKRYYDARQNLADHGIDVNNPYAYSPRTSSQTYGPGFGQVQQKAVPA